MTKPTSVYFCGSTRFWDEFQKQNQKWTLQGMIVLTVGCNLKSDAELFTNMSPEELRKVKAKLDVLHFRKIDLCDQVYVLNVGGYIGESTEREIEYAKSLGKHVYYLEVCRIENGNVHIAKKDLRPQNSTTNANAPIVKW